MSKALGDKGFPLLKAGQVLDGRFVIHDLIGKGGQGMVYKLRHLEWDRDFALKLPLPHVVRAEHSRELYLKEAQAWIRLGVHPNIVRCWFVRPVGELPALFLDLMTGGSLESKISSKAIAPGEWDKIVQVLLQVLEGLVHAHSMDMVHRDLKPENLMVHSDGRVCITDFGLVKTLSDSGLVEGLDGPLPVDSSVTAGAMGTPRYGAPEQWLNSGSVNAGTDIYSLGIIMFELMCGQRPFDPPDRPADPMTLVKRHISEDPPHPRSVREDVPPELADLCMKMMSKFPQDRPRSAETVLHELLSILSSRGQGRYQRPSPVPGGERPDLLNNAAASLYSLGKTQKARELLLKGLMIEAGHPQCLYNLMLLDRREGKLVREEAIRRLKRARAFFGMALLHMEGSQGKEAAAILSRIPEREKSGFLHRLEADALMYAGEYDKALASYQKAALAMPNDLPTKFRQELAAKRVVETGGHLYFPPMGSTFTGRSHRPVVKLALAPDAESLLVMDESEVVSLCWRQNKVLQRARRELYATPVLWSEARGSVLLLQERGAFEIWNLSELRMLSRIEGKVLAKDSELRRLLVLAKEGLVLFDRAQKQATPIALAPGLDPRGPIMAAFTYDQNGLGLLTPDGRLCAVGANAQAMPLPWPPAIEAVAEVRHFCLGKELAAVTDRNSLLRCFCLHEKRVTAEVELGFILTSLECDESGTLVVASSPIAHAVLDRHGRFITRGPGPLALDASRSHCLVWADSRLQLFQLKPFQHLRSWEKSRHDPGHLQFSRDGRRALSMAKEGGEYQIWEVDEESRVFERNMLMTPGQTYQEIVAGFEQFQAHFHTAGQLLQEGRLHDSYQSLCRAREVSGFHQNEDALRLQWTLCGALQREGLEAIWERLYISDTVSGQLSADSRHLLLAQEQAIDLYEISGPRIDSKLKLNPDFALISAYFLKDGTDGGLIMACGRDGQVAYYRADTGELYFQGRFKTGRLASVQIHEGLGLLHSKSGQAFSLDLSTAKMSEPIPLMERSLKKAFLLDDRQALVVTHQGCLMAELKKNTSRPGVPASQESIQGEITFCADCEEGKLRLIGFADGTLLMSQPKTGRALYAVKQESGAVSAAAVSLETGLGVSVSDEGGITFFDLTNGSVLDHFAAHAEGVADLSITQNGRYITTRSHTGQFRLWEVSWSLSETPGRREIEWMPTSTLSKLGKLFRGR